MGRRVKIDYSTVLTLFPEARLIPYLPRKKKKVMKKKISDLVVEILRERIVTDDYLTECFSKLKEFKKVGSLEKK